jgi:polysaccharide biosynthesis transport protein
VLFYRSAAQVFGIKKRPEEITGIKQLAIEDYMATHQVLLRSPWVVNKTVEKGRLKALEMFAGLEKSALARALIDGLRVQGADGGVNILEVSFRGGVAEECGLVVDAILESYKEFLDETYANVSDETVKLVTQMRNILEKELREKETAYRAFRQTSPVFLRGEEGKDEHQELLATLQAKKAALVLRRIELQSQLNALDAGRKEGRSRDAMLALLADYAGKADERDETHGKRPAAEGVEGLFALLLEEQKLAESYGAQHPDLLAIRKRITFTRDYFASPHLALPPNAPGEGNPDKTADAVGAYVDKVKERLRQLAHAERFYNELIEKERPEAGKVSRFETEDDNYRKEIGRLQQFYDGLVKRLHEVGLAQQTQPGGYDARVISPPGVGNKVAPRLTPIFLTSGVLGLLAGLGAAYLVEVTDRRFHSLEEVRQRLGLPVVGYLPLLTVDEAAHRPAGHEDGPALAPTLVTYHRSRSMEAEAYRGVRTALYFSTGEGHKIVQITSPNPGDGKSTVASNLAVSIAQSGKRTLLIDADLRRPTVHKVMGLSNEVGLASLIAGVAEPAEVIHETSIPNLSILTTGPLPPNPAELLTSSAFKDLLDLFRERYDFVLLDTPPLLAVTDPCVVAPRTDGVLLVIRIIKNGRPMAERAKEILAALGVAVFGVIVNAVEEGAITGHGYGYYAYRYGRYGYGYGYSGEDSQILQDQGRPRAASVTLQAEGTADKNGAAG